MCSWLPENTCFLMEEKVEMTQKNPHPSFGTPQKMSQLAFIGYNSPIDFSAFWGPSWDLLKDQICCINNYIMIVVAGIARARWDDTCLHVSVGFRELSEAFCRWSAWQVWGWKAGGSPRRSAQGVFRPATRRGCRGRQYASTGHLPVKHRLFGLKNHKFILLINSSLGQHWRNP